MVKNITVKEKKQAKPIQIKKNLNLKPELQKLNRAERLLKIKEKISKLVKLDEKQILTAIKCLLEIQKKQNSNDILNIGDDFIYLEIVVSKVPKKFSIRPVQIPLHKPIYSQEMNSKICIFSANPQRKYKEKISDLDIPLIQRVIGYSKIQKKYPSYLDKRKLMYEYDLFFCDKNIYRLLDKHLGQIFYERKKIPFPIDCEQVPIQVQEQIKSQKYDDYLNDLSNYSYFSQGTGPVYTLKIARVAFDEQDIFKNVMSSVYNLLPNILCEPGMSLSTLRMINIKLASSVSLPVFVRLNDREKEVYTKFKQL